MKKMVHFLGQFQGWENDCLWEMNISDDVRKVGIFFENEVSHDKGARPQPQDLSRPQNKSFADAGYEKWKVGVLNIVVFIK